MRLSAKSLLNFNSVNSYTPANQWTIRAGETNTLYFQLIDLDQAGLRYIAGVGGSASVQVTFPSIDDSQVISVAAVANANDASIWSVSLSSVQVPNSGNVQFAVTETSTRRFSVTNMISVEYPQNVGCDGTIPNRS